MPEDAALEVKKGKQIFHFVCLALEMHDNGTYICRSDLVYCRGHMCSLYNGQGHRCRLTYLDFNNLTCLLPPIYCFSQISFLLEMFSQISYVLP